MTRPDGRNDEKDIPHEAENFGQWQETNPEEIAGREAILTAIDDTLAKPDLTAELAALRTAVMTIAGACREYLEPAGLPRDDFIQRVLAAVDDPAVKPHIKRLRPPEPAA
jgi:hypothetical protein